MADYWLMLARPAVLWYGKVWGSLERGGGGGGGGGEEWNLCWFCGKTADPVLLLILR